MPSHLTAGAAAIGVVVAAGGAAAQNSSSFIDAPDGGFFTHAPVTGAMPCEALASQAFPSVTHIAAERPEGASFCRVTGIIAPEIQFEVALPDGWNRRLYMFGNGGWAGENLAEPARVARRDAALAEGFMSVQQNTGHDAATEPLGTFADRDLQALVDYAHRAVHETVATAKEVAAVYYDRGPAFSYWDGCSTGGRQGLMSAQRYPADFDGIVAGAPVLDLSGTQMWGVWNAQQLARAPIPTSLLPVFADAVMEKCDAVDGLEDGLIGDPRQCDFDPMADLPMCEGGGGDGCFTEAQAGAIAAIHGGLVVQGEQVFPGVPWGVEGTSDGTSGWDQWIVVDDGKSRQLVYGETFLQNMLLLPERGVEEDWETFDFDARYGEVGMIRDLVDATDPDLQDFAARGGRMITYFGWSDPALNPLMGVEYYEAVQEEMGAEETRDFYRLYMLPGMFHCRSGYGPDTLDAMTPLIEWVETGKAPEALETRQMEGETVVRSRPACPYPQVAVHDGSGDPDDAASFSCEAPASQ